MSMIMQGCSQGGFEGFGRTPNLKKLWDYLLSRCMGAGAVTDLWQAKVWYLQHQEVIFECSLQAYPG